MFGDQPEAADLGRNCEICKVELETELPWCECCTKGKGDLWERLEQLKISSSERNCHVDIDRMVGTNSQLEFTTRIGDAD